MGFDFLPGVDNVLGKSFAIKNFSPNFSSITENNNQYADKAWNYFLCGRTFSALKMLSVHDLFYNCNMFR